MFKLLKMRYSLAVYLMLMPAVLFTSVRSYAQSNPEDKIHLGILYPLSTHGAHAAADTNLFSFHVLAGVSACEKGLSFSGVSNVVRHDASGLQFGGFSNHIGKSSEGLLFAGFINTYRDGRGLQFAGFSNIARGDIQGAQFAGFLNKAKNVKGSQFAGFTNISGQITGSQFAGFSNNSSHVTGSQFAGFINTAGDVKGSQFAGFINVAKKVKGAQIAGFINIADSSDTPLGFVNIIKDGEKSIGISTDETLTWLLSFRSGGRILYGILGAGYHFDDDQYAFEAGFGAHLLPSGVFRINLELAQLILENFKSGDYFKSSLRLLPAVQPLPGVELYGGPVFNYVNTNTIAGRELQKHYLHSWESRWGNTFQGIYIGYTAGISILF